MPLIPMRCDAQDYPGIIGGVKFDDGGTIVLRDTPEADIDRLVSVLIERYIEACFYASVIAENTRTMSKERFGDHLYKPL